jgi:hypothetical protein
MSYSVAANILAGAVSLGLALSMPAYADGMPAPPDDDAAQSCQQMLDRAQSSVAKMTAGVEKMAAQNEIASAKVDRDKGEIASCKPHIRNAMVAMRSK